MVFLPKRLREHADVHWKPLVLMGSEVPFPFRARPSTILVDGMPEGAIACMPMLDEWGVPSRLASLAGYPGCYEGYVTDLAAAWLASLDRAALDRSRNVRLRPDGDAQGRRGRRASLRHSVPGFARRIHGLRRRRLRRLRSASRDADGPGDEAGVCGWAGLRRSGGVRRLSVVCGRRSLAMAMADVSRLSTRAASTVRLGHADLAALRLVSPWPVARSPLRRALSRS